MLDSLRIRPLLAGWRGAPGADVEALTDVVVAIATMAVELGEVFDAVEANPVIVSPFGAVAVDVLAVPRAAQNTAMSPAPTSTGSPPSGVTVMRPDSR